MILDFEHMVLDLSRQITAEEERTGIKDAGHFAYSTFAKAAGLRRSNLQTSIVDLRMKLDAARREHEDAAMELRKGDIQFVNNFLILHSRTGYRDSPERTRKLLRLWLDDENSQRIGPGKMDWYLPEHSRFTRIGGIASLAAAE